MYTINDFTDLQPQFKQKIQTENTYFENKEIERFYKLGLTLNYKLYHIFGLN